MLYSVLFRFGHIRRWDQCAVYILYSKISTDPGLLKIRHSHRFVAVVIQYFIPLKVQMLNENVDKQSQNTHVGVNIFARQKVKGSK